MTAVVYYYKFGKETVQLKMLHFVILGILFIVQMYNIDVYSRDVGNINHLYCIQDIYGQWVDFIVGHFLQAIIYGYWIYSSRQGTSTMKKDTTKNENQLSRILSSSINDHDRGSANGDDDEIVINCDDHDDTDKNSHGDTDCNDTYYDLELNSDTGTNDYLIVVVISRILGAVLLLLYVILVFVMVALDFILVNGRIYLLGML